MRVGLGLAAAAAALLCAGQAEAVNYIQYVATGSAVKYDYSLPAPYVSSVSPFSIGFILDADLQNFGLTYGRGSVTNGRFEYEYAPIGDTEIRVGVQLPDTTASSFPTAIATYSISGTAYINLGGRAVPKFINASIDKFYVVGPVAAYTAPTYSLPEPQTWAMMIAGFGAIGALLRRRVRVLRPAAA